jgi:hypothetical protein
MDKVGCQVMSIVLLPLICGSCATEGGILYGSKIELEAGSGDGNESNAESRAVLRRDILRLWPRGGCEQMARRTLEPVVEVTWPEE